MSRKSYRNASSDRLRLVLSTRTGALLALPDAVATALGEGSVPAVDAALREKLVKAELIVASDSDEFAALRRRNETASASFAERTFVLLPTSYCNMGCSYCGQRHTRGAVGSAHRAAVLDRVERAMRRMQTKAVDVRWFGAEPMMAYKVVLSMGARFLAGSTAHGVQYRSSMTTNGALLTVDKLIRLRHEAGVTHYNLTIDGPEAMHNSRRPLKSGHGSYEHITRLVHDAVCVDEISDVVFDIRTNIDEHNVHAIPELLTDLARRGFAHERVFFSPAPVHTWAADTDMSDRIVDWREFARREIEWLRLMVDLGLRFRSLPRAAKPVVCEAVTRSAEVISSTGRVFSCTEQPLVPLAEVKESLGHLLTIGASSPRPTGEFDDWTDRVARGEFPCRNCGIFGVCGGSCPKSWLEGQVPCPTYKLAENMQYRLDIAAARAGLVECLAG